jgi:hypothetical protein
VLVASEAPIWGVNHAFKVTYKQIHDILQKALLSKSYTFQQPSLPLIPQLNMIGVLPGVQMPPLVANSTKIQQETSNP